MEDRATSESRAVTARRTGDGALLEIEDLHTRFFSREGVARAVDGVSYTLDRGQTLGIVGESGCGKSVCALSILRLIPDPPGRIVRGAIRFQGSDLLGLTHARMQDVRGNEISIDLPGADDVVESGAHGR